MIVYRFAYPRFATDLSGTGARLRGGRWIAGEIDWGRRAGMRAGVAVNRSLV